MVLLGYKFHKLFQAEIMRWNNLHGEGSGITSHVAEWWMLGVTGEYGVSQIASSNYSAT